MKRMNNGKHWICTNLFKQNSICKKKVRAVWVKWKVLSEKTKFMVTSGRIYGKVLNMSHATKEVIFIRQKNFIFKILLTFVPWQAAVDFLFSHSAAVTALSSVLNCYPSPHCTTLAFSLLISTTAEE